MILNPSSLLTWLSLFTSFGSPQGIIEVPLNEITAYVILDDKVFDEKYNSLYINPDSIYGASNYGDGDNFNNKLTANGEIYDHYAYKLLPNNDTLFTAANFNLPFNIVLRITNVENNRSVLVRINDGGPYKCIKGTNIAVRPLKAFPGRKFDLNTAAAKSLGTIHQGIGNVRAEIVGYYNGKSVIDLPYDLQYWLLLTDVERRQFKWKKFNLRNFYKIKKTIN